MRGLELLQFIHALVVLGVADFRRVEYVVQVLVMAQVGAQFFYPLQVVVLCSLFRTHGQDYKRPQAR